MISYRWPDMSLTALGIKVHEYALQNGRCVVSMHGRVVYLACSMDARNADDTLATIEPRHSFEYIHTKLLSGMCASITEDTRG